jgi:putative ABC transport system permease protein
MTTLNYLTVFLLRVLMSALVAMRALRRNKLRSVLTALGIIIGVASVVAMVAVGNGAQVRIETQVSALGQNLLMVFAGNRKAGAVNTGMGTASTLTLADMEAIRKEIADVVAVSPEVSVSAQVIGNARNWSTTVVGESAVYLKIRDWSLAQGSMFTEREVHATAKVAVLGSKTANQLFGPLNPVGQNIRIKNIPFVVIGVLESKGAGMGGQNQDDRIIIPYTTAMRRITGDKYLRLINLQIVNASRMEAAQQQITGLLRQRHNLSATSDDDFNIFNQKEIADTVNSISRVITLMLGAVASISLFVGGIGIMNIMLVSVTERTREIGIRIAVGAQPVDIRLQFLAEAVTLSLLGGFIGVLLGVGISQLVGVITSFNAVVSTGSIILAFGVSSIIGIFFGFYPAHKASKLNPIDALRYE